MRRPAKVAPPDLPPSLHGAVPDAETDLHGLTLDQAERRVAGILDAWSRPSAGGVLRIVTGKGNRSSGAPVLREAVGELLRNDPRVSEATLDRGGGGWLVRVRGSGR